MSTIQERDKAWQDIYDAIQEYVDNAVDIEIARRGFKDSSSSVFKMDNILKFADEAICSQFEQRLEENMIIINGCFLPENMMFFSWILKHEELVEEKDSKDGKYKEIYYKPDGSLMYRFEKIEKEQ